MSKGSGATRSSSSSSPRGTVASGSGTLRVTGTSDVFSALAVMYPRANVSEANGSVSIQPGAAYSKEDIKSTMKDIKDFQKESFTDSGLGSWELDGKLGGAQILKNTEPGGVIKYEVLTWDDDYKMSPRKAYDSLSIAKQRAKSDIISAYAQKHKK